MSRGNNGQVRMNLDRLRRLLQLIELVQSGGSHLTTEYLAQECGVSRRTIYRDLDALREAGVPIIFDEAAQSYQLEGERLLPPTNFTADEAMALIVLCHELGNEPGLPFYQSASRAALKIESALPARLREELQRRRSVAHIQLTPANPLERAESFYRQLVDAVAQRRAIRIRYESFSEEKTFRTKLFPYRLLFSRRSWYVIGRSSLHRAVRTFNVGRILQIDLLDERYEIPPRFSLKRYLRNAWHLIPEPGPDRDVHIRFRPMVARNVAEVRWHATQQLEFREDGSLDFRATVSGLNEIAWWVLGYGDQAMVLDPPELREIVVGRAQRMLAQYGTPADVPAPRYLDTHGQHKGPKRRPIDSSDDTTV